MQKMSVVVITYNQSNHSIAQTLNSIVSQDLDDFEIIVSDDASNESPEDFLYSYFREIDFTRFKIIIRKKNVGIVKNILGAMEVAEGEYVKSIGAGDLLYSSTTLRKMHKFCKQNEITLGFGKVKAFSLSEGIVKTQPFNSPRQPELYKHIQNQDELLNQLLFKDDWLPGVGLFYRRDALIGYFSMLADDYQVKYCEDLVTPLVLLFGDKIDYFDECILWYEWGVGISNDGSAATRNRMYKDHENFFSCLSCRYPDNAVIQKSKKRFKLKQFVMLRTPLSNLLNQFRSSQYLNESAEHENGIAPEEEFLVANLNLK